MSFPKLSWSNFYQTDILNSYTCICGNTTKKQPILRPHFPLTCHNSPVCLCKLTMVWSIASAPFIIWKSSVFRDFCVALFWPLNYLSDSVYNGKLKICHLNVPRDHIKPWMIAIAISPQSNLGFNRLVAGDGDQALTPHPPSYSQNNASSGVWALAYEH